jgi:ubiquitin thioesterase protein OTUB1
MFQPQPTPFASSSFASYGLASDLDFAFPVSAGGGGAGFYNNSPAPSSQLPQSHPLQSQTQQQQPRLVQQLPRQQQLSSSPTAAAPSVSSPYSSSQNSTSKASSSPTLAQPPQSHRHQQQQQLDILQQTQYATQPPVVLKMEDQGQHDMAAQQAAAEDYQPVLEVYRTHFTWRL